MMTEQMFDFIKKARRRQGRVNEAAEALYRKVLVDGEALTVALCRSYGLDYKNAWSAIRDYRAMAKDVIDAASGEL